MTLSKGELRQKIAVILQSSTESLPDGAGLHEHPGWDSIAQIEIMLLLSEQFSIAISDATIETYSKLENILKLAD